MCSQVFEFFLLLTYLPKNLGTCSLKCYENKLKKKHEENSVLKVSHIYTTDMQVKGKKRNAATTTSHWHEVNFRGRGRGLFMWFHKFATALAKMKPQPNHGELENLAPLFRVYFARGCLINQGFARTFWSLFLSKHKPRPLWSVTTSAVFFPGTALFSRCNVH